MYYLMPYGSPTNRIFTDVLPDEHAEGYADVGAASLAAEDQGLDLYGVKPAVFYLAVSLDAWTKCWRIVNWVLNHGPTDGREFWEQCDSPALLIVAAETFGSALTQHKEAFDAAAQAVPGLSSHEACDRIRAAVPNFLAPYGLHGMDLCQIHQATVERWHRAFSLPAFQREETPEYTL